MGPALQGSLQYCGRTGASAPTEAQQEVQWAGDRKGRPYESVTRSVTSIGRADVGSELSAAGGRGSEVSEWPRSKFSASAVRQRKNFGHRNRVIDPYGENLGRTKGKSKRIPEYPLAFSGTKESEVLDDVNDFSTNALLSFQGGGADMSGRLENVPVAHF